MNLNMYCGMLKEIINNLGYEVLELDISSTDLNIVIDKSDSQISISDCVLVHKAVAAISKDKNISVSSPGINRKLYSLEECTHHIGKIVVVSYMDRKINGILESIVGEEVYIRNNLDEIIPFYFKDTTIRLNIV